MNTDDFLAKRFDRWEGPILLSHSDRERIGCYSPRSLANNSPSCTESSTTTPIACASNMPMILRRSRKRDFETIDPQKVPDTPIAWHIHVRSAGPPPIKTDKGWLVLYHAHDAKEPNRYKLGAMLLDLVDPTKVLYRATAPILSPDETYENHGKPGIVYACGAVVRDGKLFVYYGGADKVVCVATAHLDSFLDALVRGSQPSLATTIPTQTA